MHILFCTKQFLEVSEHPNRLLKINRWFCLFDSIVILVLNSILYALSNTIKGALKKFEFLILHFFHLTLSVSHCLVQTLAVGWIIPCVIFVGGI